VDKKSIVQEITQMGSLPANGVLPPGMPGHDPDLQGYSYDPARAKQLLAAAGYPEGKGFPVVQLWSVSKAESTKVELAAYQQYLAELGIKIDLRFVEEWTRFTEMLGRGELQMFRYAWYADFPDPDSFFFPLLHSAGQPNNMFYRNPHIDQLLEKAREETDYTERVKLYRQAERVIIEDAPWITQHNHSFEYLYQPYVHGVEVSLLGDRWIPMNKIWLKHTTAEDLAGTPANDKPAR
jgi:peptide/nickel transport system substrate-binding protein